MRASHPVWFGFSVKELVGGAEGSFLPGVNNDKSVPWATNTARAERTKTINNTEQLGPGTEWIEGEAEEDHEVSHKTIL